MLQDIISLSRKRHNTTGCFLPKPKSDFDMFEAVVSSCYNSIGMVGVAQW